MTVVRSLAGSVWVRALVSLALLGLIATRVDFGEGIDQVAAGHWGLYVGAIATFVAAFALGAFRWHVYLDAAGIPVTLASAGRAYFVGVFTTNFLPSQVGGDVARAWIVGAAGLRTRALVTVAIDRVTALACLFAVAWVAVAILPSSVPRTLVVALALATVGFALVCALLVGVAVGRLHLGRLVPDGLRRVAVEVRSSASGCLGRGVLARTIALGLVVQVGTAVAAWLVAETISLDVSLSALVVILPLVVALGVIPFSIGGLGVREGGFVVLLGRAGVDATDAAVFSLLFGLAFALASVPGAGALVLGRSARSPVHGDAKVS